MHPLWSPWNFTSYSTCMALGFFAAFLLGRRRAPGQGIARRHVENIILLTVLAGVGGAMAFGKIFYEQRSLWEVLKIWEPGGRVYYGGFICGVVAMAGYSLARGLPVLGVLDLMSAPAALGLAIGRVGCFLGGCCWGRLCADWFPFGASFPAPSLPYEHQREAGLIAAEAARSLPVHAVQLYEAAGVLLLAWWLDRRLRARNASGAVFAQLLVGYAALRFTLEFLRADNARAYAGLTLAQATAVALALVGLVLWRGVARRAPAPAVAVKLMS